MGKMILREEFSPCIFLIEVLRRLKEKSFVVEDEYYNLPKDGENNIVDWFNANRNDDDYAGIRLTKNQQFVTQKDHIIKWKSRKNDHLITCIKRLNIYCDRALSTEWYSLENSIFKNRDRKYLQILASIQIEEVNT